MPEKRTEYGLVNYFGQAEVDIVKERIPTEFRKRLRDVFLKRISGMRSLGSVRIRGRRDINLCCVLPPRVSLRRYIYRGQSALEFGAPLRGQWPPWAVRRFLLYDVFLHVLGHLQVVNPDASDWKRRFAGEKHAEEFADYWRRKLQTDRLFYHPDLVHQAPTQSELDFIKVWQRLDKARRYRLVMLAKRAPHDEEDLSFLGAQTESQEAFIEGALFRRGTAFDAAVLANHQARQAAQRRARK